MGHSFSLLGVCASWMDPRPIAAGRPLAYDFFPFLSRPLFQHQAARYPNKMGSGNTPDDWKISPNYYNSQLQSGDIEPIHVFADAVNGWVFDFAQKLTTEEHGGIGVLLLAMSPIEQLQRFHCGDTSTDNAGKFFKEGLRRIFGLADDDVVDLLYKQLRCGVVHTGLIRNRIVISHELAKPIEKELVPVVVEG